MQNNGMDIDLMHGKIATIRFHHEGQVSAAREFDRVTLRFPLQMTVQPEPAGSTWICYNIDAEIFGVQPGGGERLLCTGRLTETLQSRQVAYPYERYVPFRCTPKAIAEYERLRNGSTVDLRLKVVAQVHELEQGTAHGKMLCEPRYISGQEDFRVDKVKWATALRNAGLSATILIEIPFPIDGEIDDEGLKALSGAFASFEHGGSTAWKDSVGHLRPFLEKWKATSPKPTVEPKDGSAADREWKLLNVRDALYKCCHFWVHEAASRCGRDDALLALSSFAALLKSHRSGK